MQFEALKACMEKNKEAYDEILKDMQDGEGVEAMLGGGGGGGASEDASSSSPQTQEQQQQQELARGSKAQSQRAAAGDETSAQNGSGLSGPQAVPSSSLLSGAAAARTRPQH